MKEKYSFSVQKHSHEKIEEQFVSDIFTNIPYEHKKTGDPYIEPTVEDAQTI